MNERDQRSVGRFVLSTVAFVAIALGVPFLLIRVSTARFGSAHPLGGVQSWDSGAIGEALRDPLSDDTVVDILLRACLCVVWIAVVVIVVDTIIEVVHQVRHRGVPMPSIRGLGWSQGIARFIAVGLLVVVPLTSVKPSLAQAPVRGPTTPAARTSLTIDDGWSRPPLTLGPNGIAQEVAPVTAVASYTVQRGDSVFSIAAELANHDEQRTWDVADEILDLNLDTTMADGQRFSNPAYLKPGWVLRLPAASTSTPAAPSGVGEGDVHVVVPGDTLWDIAEDELGSGIEWSQIWQENAGDDMGAGRTFDDPDLILPGWQLELPDEDSATVSPPSESTAPTEAAVPEAPAESPSTTILAAPAGPGLAESDVVDSPWAEPRVVDATTSSSTSPSTTAPPNVADAAPRSDLPGRTSAPDAPSPIRLEHAAMLAAGILMLVGVRRRQRLRAATPRSRVPEPRPDVVDTELLLRRIDPGERAARIDVACRSAASALVDTDVQIVALQVSPEGEIALTLSGVAAPSAPWTGDGNLWHLEPAVPIELLGEAARRVGMPCVALVQLGIDHDGSDVLVDLEACGTLAIDAQPGQADGVVRGLAAGLATSMYAEVAHLITVSMPHEVLLGHRNAHRADSVDAAFELAASLVGSTSQNERSSFELRSLRTGGEMWEPAIVFMNDRDGADHADGLPFPVPGHGIAVVAAVGPGGLPRRAGQADGRVR